MNCIYCTLTESSTSLDFLDIPDGYEFLSLNSWQDFCFCGANNSCEYTILPRVTYCYAKIECEGNRHPVPDPLEVSF